MTVQEIINIISTVGFPIACCLYLFWYMNKSHEQHQDEISQLTAALNNNTLAMSKVADRLDYLEEKVCGPGSVQKGSVENEIAMRISEDIRNK